MTLPASFNKPLPAGYRILADSQLKESKEILAKYDILPQLYPRRYRNAPPAGISIEDMPKWLDENWIPWFLPLPEGIELGSFPAMNPEWDNAPFEEIFLIKKQTCV